MKKNILFVDDEPNILKGLQRSLRPLRTFWDMEFAEGAKNALALLERQAFDVIVSDMRMPEMDGAELLKIVQKKYPTMVRIILSGHSDQEMAMKSLKAAHQYLSKPCEKDVLIIAIARACALRDLLNKKTLQDLLGRIETMPSIPSLYSRIMEALRSSESSLADVGEIITKDMGMTAKVLQLVNSSFFGMPRHISGAKEAVALLGMDVVKILVLSIEVFSISKNAVGLIPVQKIHEHCIRTGVIANKIAGLEKMDKKKSDNAMMASILHDLGKLLLAEYFTSDYAKVMEITRKDNITVFEAEKAVFGVTHAEVGAYLLGLWGLPEAIVAGIAFHHTPSKYISKEFELCGIVHVAELMEHHEQQQPAGWDRLNGLDEDYLEKLGLSDRIPLWRDYIRGNPF